MVSPSLCHALADQSQLPLRHLPADVAHLLQRLDAPPRLAAHLRAVHDVACALTRGVAHRWPGLVVDPVAVHFGAATHDIGKVRRREELSGPGSAHEAAGHALLLEHGVPHHLARFAATHGTWSAPQRSIEDLLVSLADTVWKGRRAADLEALLVARLATATGMPPWQAFLHLDEVVEPFTADAEARLSFQAGYPVTT